MGFGLPAAMGVQLAYPDSMVACVTGEASVIMCIQELSTCKQYDLPIKIINLNNRYMGMVRQWQEFFYDRRYSHSYMDALPDFVKLAEVEGLFKKELFELLSESDHHLTKSHHLQKLRQRLPYVAGILASDHQEYYLDLAGTMPPH